MKQKAVCLVSGGIDSPVAAALASKKFKIIVLHFCLFPFYCEGSVELVLDILKKLKKKLKFEKILIFHWGDVLSAIIKNCKDRRYQCVLCRKSMFKIAEQVAKKENASVIITGEALAQKASQTLENMYATGFGISVPIIRPLIGLDKIEIEALAKKLSVWSEKHVGCCKVVPQHPLTRVDAQVVEKIYNEIGVDKIISEQKPIEIKNLEDAEKLFFEITSSATHQ